MTSFYLQIVAPDGKKYAGMAEKILLRTINGDVCILERHTDYITALGLGECRVTDDKGNVRSAACIGGMLLVTDGMAHVVASAFEWADEIDTDRVEASYQRARSILQDKQATSTDVKLAEARLRRALVRKNVASMR